MKREHLILLCVLVIGIGVFIVGQIYTQRKLDSSDDADNAECIDAGGQPFYDVCVKHIEFIRLPGHEYSSELDTYK